MSPVVGGKVIISGASVGVRVKSGTKVTLGWGVSSVDKACWAARAVMVPLTAACTSLMTVVVREATGDAWATAVGDGVPEQAASRMSKNVVLIFGRREIMGLSS